MRYIFFLPFYLSIVVCKAQTEPKLFEPEIISDRGTFGLTLSPDSRIALWVSSNGKRDTLRIMESIKENGHWSKPHFTSFSSPNGEWKDIDPMFSPDGKKVLFQSNRNTQRKSDRKDFDIWSVDLMDTGWAKPRRLEGSINSEASESFASITKDGTIYFMKENDNKVGLSDIYYSISKEGKYEEPRNIGLPTNTNERESNPYISPNGKYIIYFSREKYGFGEADLYISFKNKNKWTTPKNLGTPINTAISEFCPFVHKKEKKLYFTRQVKEGDRFKEEIYYIEFDVKKYK